MTRFMRTGALPNGNVDKLGNRNYDVKVRFTLGDGSVDKNSKFAEVRIPLERLGELEKFEQERNMLLLQAQGLEGERDLWELRAKQTAHANVEILNERNSARKERDELAAMVEPLRKFLEEMHQMPIDWTIERSIELHRQTPPQMLIERDLEMKIHGASELCRRIPHPLAGLEFDRCVEVFKKEASEKTQSLEPTVDQGE